MADSFFTSRPPLLASQLLAELGPVLTGERDLSQTANGALEVVMAAVRAGSGALFRYQEKPAMLASIAAQGFVVDPHLHEEPVGARRPERGVELQRAAPRRRRRGAERVGLSAVVHFRP